MLSYISIYLHYGHPCAFPEELAKRVIKLFSYRGDLVLDPFSGAGTTPYMAKKLGRRYLAFDIDEKYCISSRSRIEEYENTNLHTDPYIKRTQRLKKYKEENNKNLKEPEERIGLL